MIKSIINLTHVNREKIAKMCVILLPGVGYARVTRSGVLILKKSRWSLFSKRIPVTDVIIKYVPIEIGRLVKKKEDRATYVHIFNTNIATVVSLVKYTDRMSLLDYIFKEFSKIYVFEEPDEKEILTYQEPITDRIQTYEVPKVFKSLKYGRNKHSLSERVERLKKRINTVQIIKFF